MFRKTNKKIAQKKAIQSWKANPQTISQNYLSSIVNALKFAKESPISSLCNKCLLIFDCDVSLIGQFKQTYFQNRVRISTDYGFSESALIYMLIVAKMKAAISRGLIDIPFPPQKRIEEELLRIVIFYMQQDQTLHQNPQPRLSFARLCSQQTNLCRLKLGLRRQIIQTGKQILQHTHKKQQIDQSIERLCSHYHISKAVRLSQIKKIRQNQKSSIQQFDEKGRQIMAEINYARYTSHHGSLKSILSIFYEKLGINCMEQRILLEAIVNSQLHKLCNLRKKT